MVKGDMRGESGDVWQKGMHGEGGMRGRGACMTRGCAWWGLCMAEGHVWLGRGHTWQGVYGHGACMRRHAWPGVCMAGDGHCSGRYASCWNAFLFDKIFVENCMKMKEIGQRARSQPLLGSANNNCKMYFLNVMVFQEKTPNYIILFGGLAPYLFSLYGILGWSLKLILKRTPSKRIMCHGIAVFPAS